jgi:hypothetical protein
VFTTDTRSEFLFSDADSEADGDERRLDFCEVRQRLQESLTALSRLTADAVRGTQSCHVSLNNYYNSLFCCV